MDILQMVKGKLSKILLKLGHILKQDERKYFMMQQQETWKTP